ncbi:MAG: molybdenum cofactor guanylyltransferase [Deltaproteobacteria bacterium]|nr:molybdenum cofactor guanylyltransferase [Deltaproteobacteria bacterium]MBW2412939.1 molybdenum cofactor guanylyltransferase [Deltaproteobacteria bacterium]
MLAGGASSRMGRDKASLDLDGTAMASRVASALGDCLSTVRIVLRPGQPNPTDLPRIDDHHEARAPIVGVAAALEAAEAPAVLVAACDLPGLHARFLLALLAHVPASGGPEIVAPRTSRGPEPLVAVYRRTLLPELGRRIGAGELALQGLLRDCDTRFVDAALLREIDPDLEALRNVNRPEDLP